VLELVLLALVHNYVFALDTSLAEATSTFGVLIGL